MSDEARKNTGKKAILKNSSGMASATFLSRILGLLRVRLEAAVLGGGEIASAWFLVFAIPNLLRRVLGEGALSTALIPLIADSELQGGKEKVRRQLAVVFAYLGIFLAVIVLVVSLFSWYAGRHAHEWRWEFFHSERIILTFQLLPLLMPYGFFICLVGVIGAVLNYAGVFLRPALAALILNVVLLLVLSSVLIWSLPEAGFLPVLALSVPFAGALQLILMVILLYKVGLFPDFRKGWQERRIWKELFKLALPGMLGYGALQVSFLIDRGMAASLGSQAVPALTYVDRIVDIPIGIVAVSVSSVLMVMMSRSAAEGNCEEIADTLAYGLRMVWFTTLPLAALVVFFHNNILQLLCLGGKYTVSDLQSAHYVAIFYGMGIPFFCSLKIILPAFYARKKMKTVFAVSLTAIVANIILNYVLMQFLAQGGIALATVIASLINNGVLLLLLKRENMTGKSGEVMLSFLRSGAISFFAAWGIFELYRRFFETWATLRWQNTLAVLAVIGVVFMGIYFAGALMTRSPELREITGLIRRRKR